MTFKTFLQSVLIAFMVTVLFACSSNDNGSGNTTEVTTATAPIVIVQGENPITIAQGESYSDLGATAKNSAGDTVQVTVSGEVDTSKAGTYKLTYTAVDSDGNTTTTSRTINVLDKTPPAITLNGDSSVDIPQNSVYTELGATAKDGGTDIDVVITGTVDTSTIGVYTITYTSTDSAGNSASTNRTVTIKSEVLFFYRDLQHGIEPWITDGTDEGTYLAKDVNTRFNSSKPQGFTSLNGITYFSADDSIHGRELWKTDGTDIGTSLVKDLRVGSDGSYPSQLVAFKEQLFFLAAKGNDIVAKGLWKTDGTDEGTLLVKDNVSKMVISGDYLYLVSKDDLNGEELWRTNGSPHNVELVKDISSGTGSSYPSFLTAFKNELYFRAYENAQDLSSYAKLWKTDGTEGGTKLVGGLPSGNDNYLSNLTVVNDILFFTNDLKSLWKIDGSESGALMVRNFEGSGIRKLTASGDLVYFTEHGSDKGLWKSDGTEQGTVKVKSSDVRNLTSASNLTDVNGTLFFSFLTSDYGVELWMTDGSEANTNMVKDKNFSPDRNTPVTNLDNFVNADGILFFVAKGGEEGYALWKSDGTDAGTIMVKDIYEGVEWDSDILSNLAYVNGRLYFSASSQLHSHELWRSDSTADGTVMIKNINQTSKGSYFNINSNGSPNAVSLNGIHYYITSGAYFDEDIESLVHNYQLWSTDNKITSLIKSAGRITNLTKLGDSVYFKTTTYDGGLTVDTALWEISKEGGMEQVKSIAIGSSYGNSMKVTSSSKALYLSVYEGYECHQLLKVTESASPVMIGRDCIADSASGDSAFFFTSSNKLWKVDNDSEEPSLIKVSETSMENLSVVRGEVFYTTTSSEGLRKLWKGESELSDDFNYFSDFKAHKDRLFFTARDTNNDYNLWVSDGTSDGTHIFTDITGGAGYVHEFMKALGSDMLFTAIIDSRLELWKTDSTISGTMKVATIMDWNRDFRNNISFSRLIGDKLIFGVSRAEIYEGGEQYYMGTTKVWITDGTDFGTKLLLGGADQ